MSLRARDFAGPAYRFLGAEAGSLAKLAAPAVLVMLIGGVVPGLAGASLDAVLSIANLVRFLVLLQFARVVYGGLAAGRPPTVAELPRIDGRTWSLAWRSVAMAILVFFPAGAAIVIAFVVSLARAFGSASGSDAEWLIWIIVAPALWLSIWLGLRLVLVPILAVVPDFCLAPVGPFGSSWALTRGHGWLIFKLMVLVVLPFALLGVLLPLAFGYGGSFALIISVVLFGAIIAVLHLALIALSGHALVALVRALTAAAAAAPHSAPGGPAA